MTTPISSATVLTTGGDDAVLAYLKAAREHHTQAKIADFLKTTPRTIRRWEARQSVPPSYVIHALQQLLPLDLPFEGEAAFSFIDLFAGIGGIRRAFEGIGGRCVYTSEWDSYAQKTYAENFRDGHALNGDITQVQAADIPDHDVLLAGFPCQPFSIAGVSKKNALGKAHGFACETQGTLFFDVARIIAEKRPRAFLLENVKNLTSHDKGRTFGCHQTHPHRRTRLPHPHPRHRRRTLRPPAPRTHPHRRLPRTRRFRLRRPAHPAQRPAHAERNPPPHDGSEPALEWDENRFFDHAANKVQDKYTLTDNLWRYLQNYAEKHRAKGNGFGFGLVTPDSVTRTLSARYYKDGSEILVYQGEGKNPRRLTPRECARLMGFPDTFRIPVSDTRAYQLFADAAVVPMIESVAKLMAPLITNEAPVASGNLAESPANIMSSNRWTREQLKLAFNLYCQLPFGKLHSRNAEIIELATLIGRTPSAVAMKLVNFASLDPAITSTGRSGLGNASSLDREVWEEFHADWERLAVECALLNEQLRKRRVEPVSDTEPDDAFDLNDYSGETRQVLTEQRIKQSFFRRAVLASYRGRCCMSGLSDSRLLIASHIVPWSKDKANRLNPSNGLCLSALHDKAFDKGLITLTDDFKILVSEDLKRGKEAFIQAVILPLDGRPIDPPERFMPQPEFVAWHRNKLFVDNKNPY